MASEIKHTKAELENMIETGLYQRGAAIADKVDLGRRLKVIEERRQALDTSERLAREAAGSSDERVARIDAKIAGWRKELEALKSVVVAKGPSVQKRIEKLAWAWIEAGDTRGMELLKRWLGGGEDVEKLWEEYGKGQGG